MWSVGNEVVVVLSVKHLTATTRGMVALVLATLDNILEVVCQERTNRGKGGCCVSEVSKGMVKLI